MANPTPPADQSPPSISAAELRRRLLASTPPPIAAPAAAPESAPEDSTEESAAPSWNGTNELLSRLKMPGKSGPVPAQSVRPAQTPIPTVPDPLPGRAGSRGQSSSLPPYRNVRPSSSLIR